MNQLNGKYVFQHFKDEAKLEAHKETALKMHFKGFPIVDIAECVGHPEEEILQWINEIQSASA